VEYAPVFSLIIGLLVVGHSREAGVGAGQRRRRRAVRDGARWLYAGSPDVKAEPHQFRPERRRKLAICAG